jgi:hypothetical protein
MSGVRGPGAGIFVSGTATISKFAGHFRIELELDESGGASTYLLSRDPCPCS